MRPVLGAVAAVALLATACGASTGSDVATLEGGGGGAGVVASEKFDQEQALLDLARCMREQGAEFPDPEIDSDGNLFFDFNESETEDVDRDVLIEAGEACEEHVEGVVLGLSEIFESTDFQDRFLVYASCVRDHGFDMPDDLDILGIFTGGEPPFDPDDPDFIAANEQCQSVFAVFGSSFRVDE